MHTDAAQSGFPFRQLAVVTFTQSVFAAGAIAALLILSETGLPPNEFARFVVALGAGVLVALPLMLVLRRRRKDWEGAMTATPLRAVVFGIVCFGAPLGLIMGARQAMDGDGLLTGEIVATLIAWSIAGVAFGLLMRARTHKGPLHPPLKSWDQSPPR